MDRGAADRYYGRSYEPHWYPEGTYNGNRVELKDMTPNEIVAYTKGYKEEESRKDWGDHDFAGG
jgi:hypothetical protein